ncbi:hypothetical protein CEY12_19595 [Chryseobacterium sp. T16E-39]|nr:hypothetical protein CEY12_19595 [Chryseobacterium sp. T16E-39]
MYLNSRASLKTQPIIQQFYKSAILPFYHFAIQASSLSTSLFQITIIDLIIIKLTGFIFVLLTFVRHSVLKNENELTYYI